MIFDRARVIPEIGAHWLIQQGRDRAPPEREGSMPARSGRVAVLVVAMFWCACAGMTEGTRVTVAVTPHEVSVAAGGAVAFTASVSGANAPASTAVTWSVQEPGGGSVDDHGLYTA